MDRLLRDLRQRDQPCGGKNNLLGGDFRQILPVMVQASAPEVVANTILNHYSMRTGLFRRYSLTENMRLKRDARDSATHRDWLLAIGDGSVACADELHPLAVPLPEHMCMPADESIASLVHWVYPDLLDKAVLSLTSAGAAQADAWLRERAILTPRNDEARRVNELVLDMLDPSTEFVSLSFDRIKDPQGEDAGSFPEEFLHTLQPSGFPPHKLRLRKGAVVILLRNLDKSRGLCNGVRLLVVRTTAKVLDVRVLSGPAAGTRVFLPRIPFLSKEGDLPFLLRRRQFPVALAWAMTIHKAQGQSLAVCGVLLERPVFTHGQLYVSASRSTSAGGLRFFLGEEEGHGREDPEGELYDGPHTHNVVFRSVFQLVATRSSEQSSGSGLPAVSPLPPSQVPQVRPVRSGQANAVDQEEHVDLQPAEEDSLHRRMWHQSESASTRLARSVESGAFAVDEDLVSDGDLIEADAAEILAAQEARARLLGVLPSVWYEVSHRSALQRELFLEVVAAPDSSGGASSSSSEPWVRS